MNIKEAKEEIIHTLKAYHEKDAFGIYRYPLVRQRPVLLMGPPGIGKTAIMEQSAAECEVGLVSYTITHHTRQSAVGLPRIVQKTYLGEEKTVTEYTLSEIVASVYDCMERTGKKEGILFIDEINCVSETLAPVMLQFLQNKMFGNHKIPEGFLIVAAGNPPEYTKSVREFDVVTMDRVRIMHIEPDLDVWMKYAWETGVHGAVLSYLSIYRERFYLMGNDSHGKCFVTARGWEDLSQILHSYERLQIPVTRNLIGQFIQEEQTASGFFSYYQLFEKYGEDYGIERLLDGAAVEETTEQYVQRVRRADFEERYTVIGLIQKVLDTSLCIYEKEDRQTRRLHQVMQYLIRFLKGKELAEGMEEFLAEQERSLNIKVQAELIGYRELENDRQVLTVLRELLLELKKSHITDMEEGMARMKLLLQTHSSGRAEQIVRVRDQISRAFAFLDRCFGESAEMTFFVMGLTANRKAGNFIGENGCDAFFVYSSHVLEARKDRALQEACRSILEK